MAKKRKYTKSNSRGNTRKSKCMSNIDLTICILIVLSILLGFLIYTNSGVIGVKLNEILGGMMGVTRLLLPIGILGVAIKLACTDNEYVSSKLIKFCVLLISISVIMCVIQISSGELIPSKEISESLKDAYYNGSQGKGGGALGALLAIPMAKLIGNIGTIIVCMGIAIILAATTFGVNVSELINMIVEKHQEKQENKKEEKLHEKDVQTLFENEFKDLKLDEIIERKSENKWLIDTVKINEEILQKAGLKKENIIDCEICSVCNSDLIHSYRVEKEKYGLSTAIIGLK